MAVSAGVRAGICMIAVPIPIRSVRAAIQLAIVTASAPQASDVHTEPKPRRSASSPSATAPDGSSYPSCRPSFTSRSYAAVF